MSGFHVIIPARLASTRLPAKPLADLAGRPLVVRVLDQAARSGADSVHVATDSEEVAAAVEAAGGRVIVTAADHRSGTDRIVEAAQSIGLDEADIVVNLQGDEPFMPPECLSQVAGLLRRHRRAQMATLWQPVEDAAQWRDPNVVKLVTGSQGRALYFSRAPIPHPREHRRPEDFARRHIGLYAYRVAALSAWPDLPASDLEAIESLEQLRALEAGWTIACEGASRPVPGGIDTATDLERARVLLAETGP